MKLLESRLTSGNAAFDEEEHIYWHPQTGERYISGSQVAKKFEPDFPREVILNALSSKHGIDREVWERSWELKQQAAIDFGNAVHGALQVYGEGLKIPGKEVICKAPFLTDITRKFFEGKEDEEALYEQFIIDEERGVCGTVDRVVIHSWKNRVLSLEDHKTNGDLNAGQGFMKVPFQVLRNKPLTHYRIQMNAYREILEAAGWEVDKMTLNWLGPEGWEYHSVPKLGVLEHLEEEVEAA